MARGSRPIPARASPSGLGARIRETASAMLDLVIEASG